MNLISALRAWIWNRLSATPPTGAARGFSQPFAAGVYVDEDVALRYAAVWACCRVIAEAIAAMPWHVMQRDGKTRKTLDGHPADWLLHTAPNNELGAYAFRETLLFWALTWGNGYAEIERDGSLRPIALWPLAPDRVRPERDVTGALVYSVSNGTSGRITIPARDMFHLKGPGWDGLSGYSPIDLARESVGLGLACQKFGSSFFSNGAYPGGVIEAPDTLQLTPDAKKILLDEFNAAHRGPANFGKTAYLDGGMKYTAFQLPLNSAQFLETRQHQILEICRWYKVPPHKLYELERATYNNVEQQQIEFLTETLIPWIRRLEEEADAKLLGPYQRGRLYTKLKPEALLRGDLKSRYDAYAVGRQWGWLSINDIRALEDLDPIPQGGNEYLTPLNMREAGSELQTAPDAVPAVTGPTEPDPATVALLALLTQTVGALTDAAQRPSTLPPIQIGLTANVTPPAVQIDAPVTVAAPAPQPAEITIQNLQAPPSIDVRPEIRVEAAPAPSLMVNIEAPPTPSVQIDAPVTVAVEAPAPQPAEITIQNLQAPPSIDVRPEIHVEAAPAPDVVLQIGEQIHDPTLPD